MISAPINDAFSQLEVTQKQLISALSAFHDACSRLYTIAVEIKYENDIYSELDTRLVQLGTQLDTLSVTEGKLGQSHSFLRRTRNLSKTMIPTNRLPPELLATIFEFAASDKEYSGVIGTDAQSHPLVAIPSVCLSWRHLALCSPRLWTSIDLSQCYKHSMMKRAVSWLQRAREVPVHLQFAQHRFFDDEELEPDFKKILTRAVSFDISASDELYVQDLFNHYNRLGGSNTLRAITMTPSLWPGKLSDHFNWSCFVPDTLTTLKLINTSGELTPTLDELTSLLSRTHNLRTLILRDVNVTTGACASDSQIHLPHLEYLESYPHRNTRPNYIGVTKQLMRSIIPGSNDIEAWLEMGEPDDDEHDILMQTFFSRSRVTRLHTGYFKPQDELTLARHLDSLPELEFLSLDFDGQTTSDILSALVVPVEGQGYSARCPKLRGLRLSEACITPQSKEQLKQIVDASNLTKLTFGDRAYFVDESESHLEDSETMDWLGERVDDFDWMTGTSWFGLAA